MAETYFKNFNTITYANNRAVDLTERVVVLNNVEKNPYLYYPTDITSGVRPDQIANFAYKDPYSSWLLYLSNDIVDPYYEWYLSDRQFNEYIAKKYGSVEIAQQKIAGYVNNWVDQSPIDIAAYEALTPARKKYWEPAYDNYGRIASYNRKKEDWKAETNSIINVFVYEPGDFVDDEIVTINYSIYDRNADQIDTTGKGQVAFSNSSCITIKHCTGDFLPIQNDTVISSLSNIYGTESGSKCTIGSANFVSRTIPLGEIIYWQPQTIYDVEQEKNEGNKTIRILQSQYVPQFIRNTKSLLGQ